ncbi:hypothetical protein B9Z55_016821 [Caenorhabditis nigoni]|uniref:Uncharacterized protein n=1 Tax=Caenorhabditis nigoni TaxID=1611254 RepID=A0A2G5T6S3_9PELO|nr:hypothetical protein B9Z55_016821 [Caenorhabditis nigoni]
MIRHLEGRIVRDTVNMDRRDEDTKNFRRSIYQSIYVSSVFVKSGIEYTERRSFGAEPRAGGQALPQEPVCVPAREEESQLLLLLPPSSPVFFFILLAARRVVSQESKINIPSLCRPIDSFTHRRFPHHHLLLLPILHCSVFSKILGNDTVQKSSMTRKGKKKKKKKKRVGSQQ